MQPNSGGLPASSGDPRLAPLRAMIELLPPDAVEQIGRALHARLNRPPTAAERRISELGFLARLLDERPQPPERLPYIERKLYDERRKTDAPTAPVSARLQEKFGSWPRACHAAFGLLDDGRHIGPGEPWARPPRRKASFTAVEAEASVRLCAESIGRIPSSHEYHYWVMNKRARDRRLGRATERAVLYHVVMKLLAPERTNRNGWDLVTLKVFGAARSGNDPLAGHAVGDAPRNGEIIEVLGEAGHEHFRVRWEDGHESINFPAEDAIISRPKARRLRKG